MARRGIPEVNAGSMADIAFLLLVFFLMVTTIESEEGIFRILPAPQEDIPEHERIIVHERDVFVVKVNMNNELLVENEYIQLDALREKATTFILSNGVFGDLPQDENLPIKSYIKRDSILKTISTLDAQWQSMPDSDEDEIKAKNEVKKLLYKWEIKQKVYDDWGRYKPMEPQSIISMQNDNGTNYETYIGVQTELTAAINQLRDDLSLDKFGITYVKLEREFDREKNDAVVGADLKEKVMMIREVYPSRIVEAEPKNVEKY